MHQKNDKDLILEDKNGFHKTNSPACNTKPRPIIKPQESTIKVQESTTKTKDFTIKPRESSLKNTDFGRDKKKSHTSLTDNKSTKIANSSGHIVKIYKNANLKAPETTSQKKSAHLETKASDSLKLHVKKKYVTMLSKPVTQQKLPSTSPQAQLIFLGQTTHPTKNVPPKNTQRNISKQTNVLPSNKKVLSHSKEKVFIYFLLNCRFMKLIDFMKVYFIF